MDITYIPMARGFVYPGRRCRLVQPPGSGMAAVDYDGGGVLRRGAGGSSVALWHTGDQHRSGQSVHRDRPARCLAKGIAISMDGKGAWRDNVFIDGCRD